MFEKMMNHKKLLIGCGCALLAIALVVCLVLVIGNGAGDKPTLPSNGTTQGTNPDGTTMTNPDGTTNPTAVPTGPSDPTVPSSDPTAPTTGATDPTEPSGTTAPTEPPYSYPTEPNGDIIPIEPPTTPTTPVVTPSPDIGGQTADTITTEVWNSWTDEQKRAFKRSVDKNSLTQDQAYNYYIVTQYGGYSCGVENHYCSSDKDHEDMLKEMALGCKYCGETDCAAFYARGTDGFTRTDWTKCPNYDERNNPAVYCQECGLPKEGKTGDKICVTVNREVDCPVCKKHLYPGQCHECTWP